ncbi:MAG: hypothetical protein WCJ07_05685 [Verrucomicrobiota bacterium]
MGSILGLIGGLGGGGGGFGYSGHSSATSGPADSGHFSPVIINQGVGGSGNTAPALASPGATVSSGANWPIIIAAALAGAAVCWFFDKK